jgi:hypothetical protein
MIKSILTKIQYNIELLSQLFVIFVVAGTYGFIESLYIPTDTMPLPIGGRWSYYHIGLVIIMLATSFSLALSHIECILTNRKKYILIMCAAAFPLSLMVEDIFWFISRWQPISRSEWTMMSPGLGINLGFSWIPLWYIVVAAISVGLYFAANKYANIGHQEYLKRESAKDMTISRLMSKSLFQG